MPDELRSEDAARDAVALWLEVNRDRIVAGWMAAVTADDEIPSADQLTMSALKDHFPQMLAELIAAVRRGSGGQESTHSASTGHSHGKTRWKQGFRLDEVLRELARIREIILLEAQRAGANIADAGAGGEIAGTIRHYFDIIAATSASEFVRIQDAELLLRSRQLENAYEQVHAATDELRSIAKSRLHLLRAVVHELRNAVQPITLIATTLLQDENQSPVERRETRNRLSASAAHLQALLDRLQQSAEILSGEARPRLGPVDLNDWLAEIEKEHRAAIEARGLQFQCLLTVAPPVVSSDRARLREIARHLLSNATRFTNQGFIRLDLAPDGGDRWTLTVTDSGSGITSRDATHIFRIFHSDSDDSGIRLGLVTTRHLARLLGGEITFHSIQGQGSSFEVNLPRGAS